MNAANRKKMGVNIISFLFRTRYNKASGIRTYETNIRRFPDTRTHFNTGVLIIRKISSFSILVYCNMATDILKR